MQRLVHFGTPANEERRPLRVSRITVAAKEPSESARATRPVRLSQCAHRARVPAASRVPAVAAAVLSEVRVPLVPQRRRRRAHCAAVVVCVVCECCTRHRRVHAKSGGAAALVDAGHEGARALRRALVRVAAVEARECAAPGAAARARVARARPHGTRPDARADGRRERECEQRRASHAALDHRVCYARAL